MQSAAVKHFAKKLVDANIYMFSKSDRTFSGKEDSIKGFTYKIILLAAEGPEPQVVRMFLVFFFFIRFLLAIAGDRAWLSKPLL